MHVSEVLSTKLKLDEDGVCAMQCDDDLPCILEVPKGSELFYLYAPLVTVPEDKESAHDLFGRSLMLNMFQINTVGGSIALSDDLDQIMFCFSSPVGNCDEFEFNHILENFVSIAQRLRKELNQDPLGPEAQE